MGKKEEPKHQVEMLPSIDMDDADSGMTTDEALAKISMALANTREPKLLSELSEDEIKFCAALYVVSEKMNDEMLKNFLDNFLRLRVSKARKGRLELLDIAKSVRENTENRVGRLRALFSGVTGK